MLSSCFKVHKLIVNSPIVTFMRVVVIDVLCHIASLFKIIIPSRYLLLSLLLPLSFPYFSCLLLLFRTYLHLSKLDFYNNCQEKSFRISTLYVHKNLNSIGKKSFYFFQNRNIHFKIYDISPREKWRRSNRRKNIEDCIVSEKKNMLTKLNK